MLGNHHQAFQPSGFGGNFGGGGGGGGAPRSPWAARSGTNVPPPMMMMEAADPATFLPALQQLSMEINNWYSRSQAELNATHRRVHDRIAGIRRQLLANGTAAAGATSGTNPATLLAGSANGGGGSAADAFAATAGSGPGGLLSTPPRRAAPPLSEDIEGDWSLLSKEVMSTPPAQARANVAAEFTPTGSPQSADKVPLDMLLSRIAAGSNSPPLNFDSIYEQLAAADPNSPANGGHSAAARADGGATGAGGVASVLFGTGSGASSRDSGASIPVESLMRMQGQEHTHSMRLSQSDSGRPTVIAIPGGLSDDPERFDIDPNHKCEVLVEFKRKRVLQYHANRYVGPGEYVVVGGDRGEDVGLVIFTWCETRAHKVKAIGLSGSRLTRSIGVGSGKVIRVAEPFEVSQLHGIQAELERRAVDVCQQRVLEHDIPMVIVDAEYQFDKKKLTFFYEAAHRQDFRELVRDLFKTFRARIWMEMVEK